MSGEGIAAIVIAVGTLIVALVNARNSARKADIDNLRDITDQQAETIKNQGEALNRQSNQIFNLECEKTNLRTDITRLSEENRVLRLRVDELTQENADLKAELDTYRGKRKRDTGGLKE